MMSVSGFFKPSLVPDFLRVPWGIKDVFLFVVAWIGIQVVVILGLDVVGPHVGAIAGFLQADKDGDATAVFVLALFNAVVGFLVVAVMLLHYRVSWSAVGWRRINILKAAVWVVGILVGFVILASLLLWLATLFVPGFDANQPQTNDFSKTTGGSQNALAFVALVLLPPILEETIFRGFLFPAVAKHWGVASGALVSSALFALAHGQANVGVYTFALGLILCGMYTRFKSIIPGVMLHMVNNYLAYLALGSK